MRNFFRRDSRSALDDQIDSVLRQMDAVGVASEEYPKLMQYLEGLHRLKAEERRPPVSRDTMLLVAGNLLGILVIVAYEQRHVMTSKGFTQIIRPKIDN